MTNISKIKLSEIIKHSEGKCSIDVLTEPENRPQMAMINRMLNTADPTIVPVPTSDLAKNTPV